MKLRRKILLSIGVTLGLLVLCFLVFVGPWPTYGSGFESKGYYKNAVAAIDRQAKQVSQVSAVGRFHAGWGSREIVPPEGTPLAGYGDRKGRPFAGVHDAIYVKALAISDGADTAVIVGSDILIVPENVADLVRARVAERSSLKPGDILFNASHNHSGPGAFGPGVASKLFNGSYDLRMPGLLATAFAEAIVDAYESLEPAKVTHGSVDVPEYIRNRTRKDAPVDSELGYMLVEQEDGDRCFVVSYSAHPTVLGSDNMQITGEYPGFLMRHITEKTGAEAIYVSGSVGSMSHLAPEGQDAFERCRAMGAALAETVLEAAAQATEFEETVDVASVGILIELPPFQLRLSEKWRVSKYLLPALGIDADGWMQAVRIGDMAMVGTPADYCGEISVDLKSWAKGRFGDMWVLSFNGDYVGYISPDKYYYDKDEDGGYGYERGLMSWIGPDQEAFTVGLIKHMIEALYPGSS